MGNFAYPQNPNILESNATTKKAYRAARITRRVQTWPI